MDDSVIAIKIKSLLAEYDLLKSFQIGVETRKRIVQLSRFVNSQQAVDKAGQIARSVKGVTSLRMEGTDKDIEELGEYLSGSFHRLRSRGIDQGLFDVISGFEALSSEQRGLVL